MTVFGWVRIARADGASFVLARMGEGAAILSGGVGGWADVPRPRRTNLTEWQGAPQHRLTLPIMFDGWRAMTSVQGSVDTLTRMGKPDKGSQPPTIVVEGALQGTNLEWVIEDIEWLDGDLRNPENDVLVRRRANVTLVQYVVGVVYVEKKDGGDTGSTQYRRHRIKKHDTLHKVAAKYAGSKKPKVITAKAKAIKKTNKIRDPKRYFKKHVGKVILIP
jgi:hypothetical protein